MKWKKKNKKKFYTKKMFYSDIVIISIILILFGITKINGKEKTEEIVNNTKEEITETINNAVVGVQNFIHNVEEASNIKGDELHELANAGQENIIIPYVQVNGNKPYFTEKDYTTEAFEKYGELDSKGRCSSCFANVCIETMPTEKRGYIGNIKPTGWVNNKYDFIDGKYLYNRCHIIGFQLTAENDNPKNLITGTRYLNIEGMLPFENMVADYVKETHNHVLYRVTPYFNDNELVCRGVEMEAYSVEDDGDGICFNIFAYNVQPGVTINYETGENQLEEK